MVFSVVLDSCVIYPMPLCDTLLRAAEAGLYNIYFSQEILDGATRNLIKNGVMTPDKAAYFQEQIKIHFPEGLVEVSKSVGKNKTELIKVNKAEILFPPAFCLLPPALP